MCGHAALPPAEAMTAAAALDAVPGTREVEHRSRHE